MLVNRSQTVSLSFVSTDSPTWNTIVAKASMFQKGEEEFHLLLERQTLPHSTFPTMKETESRQGIFWLDISPYRVTMTMQSNGKLSYRHFWERGIYGMSRYCLNTDPSQPSQSIRFQNFTRYLQVENDPFPRSVRIEYELWSANSCLGSYLMHVEIDRSVEVTVILKRSQR